MVRSGDWPAVARLFAGLSDPDDRGFVVSVLAEVSGAETFLGDVTAGDPAALLPRVLLAARYVRMGWDARTGLRARQVSSDQFAVFHDYLRRAERLLLDVTAREPSDAGRVVVRVGRADETLPESGVSHLVEHLALHRLGLTDYHTPTVPPTRSRRDFPWPDRRPRSRSSWLGSATR